MRPGGSDLNGSGFDTGIASYGTDYTQQDAAQLSLTDLACITGTSTVTSVTGGFTAAMIGNAICISSGTNFTVGYYFITAVASSNSITVDRTPVGGTNGSAGVGNVGGAGSNLRSFVTNLAAAVVAGNTIWVKSGAYSAFVTNGAGATVTNGTTTALIKVLGYNTVRGDSPTLANRPVCTKSSILTLGQNNYLANIVFIATGSAVGISTNSNNTIVNCNCTTVGGNAYNLYGNCTILNCVASSTTGHGFANITNGCTVIGSTTVGCAKGYQVLGNVTIVDCICYGATTTGIYIQATGVSVINCNIYNCTVGIDHTVAVTCSTILNNIITNNTTAGLRHITAGYVNSLVDYNDVYNNGTNYVNMPIGAHDKSVDPLYVSAGTHDFTLQAASPCINTGITVDNGQGVLVGTYPISMGVDQSDHVSGGASNFASW